MSRALSLRLKDGQFEHLRHEALRENRTPAEMAVILLEEALRMREHGTIEFRDSPAGRQAYLRGTRIAVWHLALIADDYGGDSAAVAAHLDIPEGQVKAALAYAKEYREEVDAAIADNNWVGEHLLPQLPGYGESAVDAAGS